ncbi:MAG: hypothetical protein WD716_09395 [Fimbriimonadaceae bacterium]
MATNWQVLMTGAGLGFGILAIVLLLNNTNNPLLRRQLNERGYLKFLQNEVTVTMEDGNLTISRTGFTSTMSLEGFHKIAIKDAGIALFHPGARALVVLRKEYFAEEGSWEAVQTYLENVPRLI